MINILWIIAIGMLVFSGLYYTIKLKFIQLNIIKIIKSLFSKSKDDISYFQVLMVSLAGKIGVGSIAGVCLSIYLGGIGTVFWMWVIAFISLPNTFVETYLGCYYQKRDQNNMIGGPSYYIKKGLNNHSLSTIYSIILIISYIGGFIAIQSNTISKVVFDLTLIKPYIIGIILSVITFYVLKGGLKKIIDVTSKLVPIMLLFYITFLLIIYIRNIDKTIFILKTIIKESLNINNFIKGFLFTMFIGIQRGIFSNESGIGTGSISSSIANVDPIKMGYVQMLGVYFATFIVCTLTAFSLIITDYNIISTDINGIELGLLIFEHHFGYFGKIILTITIILFAISTILTGYYYSESCLKSLIKTNKKIIFLLKIANIIFVFIGTITIANKLWEIVDILVAILLIINSYAIMKLRKVVKL